MDPVPVVVTSRTPAARAVLATIGSVTELPRAGVPQRQQGQALPVPHAWSPPPGWAVSRAGWRAGYLTRRAVAVALPLAARRRVRPSRQLDADVVCFSSQRDLPEQVASLRSLLRYAGRPRTVTVASDGSHTASSRRLLESVDRRIRVVDWAALVSQDPDRVPQRVWHYAAASPMGKKLAVELSLPVRHPTLYVDADVLFFPAAASLGEDLAHLVSMGTPAHLVDAEDTYLDERLLRSAEELRPPTNAGFLILPRPLDWTFALQRLLELVDTPGFHTEQTVVHLAMRAANAEPLDPRRYVVATDDMPLYRDAHAGPALVLRHYTSPVRHKFWGAVARSRLPAASTVS
jgi:hypothetical protein